MNKDLPHKLLKEFMRDPKRSDRAIAGVLGVSQPTITRARRRMEEAGLISFIGVPDLAQVGMEILAFNKLVFVDPDDVQKIEDDDKVIFAFMIEHSSETDYVGVLSAHKNYAAYLDWKAEYFCDPDSVVASTSKAPLKALTFKDLPIKLHRLEP